MDDTNKETIEPKQPATHSAQMERFQNKGIISANSKKKK